MKKPTEFKIEHVSFSSTTGSELRGRQSIRATFKLTAGCIDAISIVAKHLGIKQKSLFDHLAEDTQVLKKLLREQVMPNLNLRSAFKRPLSSAGAPCNPLSRSQSFSTLLGMCWWNIPSSGYSR